MLDVILLTHNHIGNTTRCVEALYQNTRETFKLTVVDDSTDITQDYFSQLSKEKGNVNYFRPDVPILNVNQALNIGIRLTQSDLVILLMNSTFVEPNWLPLALEIMKGNPRVGVVGFKILDPNSHTIIEAGDHVWPNGNADNVGRTEASHRYSHVREVNALGWAVVLVRRAAIPEGGFNETYYNGFHCNLDMDNCLEMRRRGWKIIYNGLGCVYHKIGMSDPKKSDKQARQELRENFYRFIDKWKGRVP